MTLVDTSVWANHLRRTDRRLVQLLDEAQVVCHPYVIGELACGHIGRRHEVLALLARLPVVLPVSQAEALAFIDVNQLAGSGVGWVDVHLLASARLARVGVFTADKALSRAAARLGLA